MGPRLGLGLGLGLRVAPSSWVRTVRRHAEAKPLSGRPLQPVWPKLWPNPGAARGLVRVRARDRDRCRIRVAEARPLVTICATGKEKARACGGD